MGVFAFGGFVEVLLKQRHERKSLLQIFLASISRIKIAGKLGSVSPAHFHLTVIWMTKIASKCYSRGRSLTEASYIQRIWR